jgi:hypothetical protein
MVKLTENERFAVEDMIGRLTRLLSKGNHDQYTQDELETVGGFGHNLGEIVRMYAEHAGNLTILERVATRLAVKPNDELLAAAAHLISALGEACGYNGTNTAGLSVATQKEMVSKKRVRALFEEIHIIRAKIKGMPHLYKEESVALFNEAIQTSLDVALMNAAAYGRVDIMKILCHEGANPNAVIGDWTALKSAASGMPQVKAVRFLLPRMTLETIEKIDMREDIYQKGKMVPWTAEKYAKTYEHNETRQGKTEPVIVSLIRRRIDDLRKEVQEVRSTTRRTTRNMNDRMLGAGPINKGTPTTQPLA